MFLNSFQIILLLRSELVRINMKAISTKTKPDDGCGKDTELPPTAGASDSRGCPPPQPRAAEPVWWPRRRTLACGIFTRRRRGRGPSHQERAGTHALRWGDQVSAPGGGGLSTHVLPGCGSRRQRLEHPTPRVEPHHRLPATGARRSTGHSASAVPWSHLSHSRPSAPCVFPRPLCPRLSSPPAHLAPLSHPWSSAQLGPGHWPLSPAHMELQRRTHPSPDSHLIGPVQGGLPGRACGGPPRPRRSTRVPRDTDHARPGHILRWPPGAPACSPRPSVRPGCWAHTLSPQQDAHRSTSCFSSVSHRGRNYVQST